VGHARGNGFTAVEVDTWLEVIPQVSLPLSTFPPQPSLYLDYCANSNASYQYPAIYQQSSWGSWKTSSTSTDILSYCGFQIFKCLTAQCGPVNYGPNAGTQPYNCLAGMYAYHIFWHQQLTALITGPSSQPRAHSRRHSMA
jgi:hypothetical protein